MNIRTTIHTGRSKGLGRALMQAVLFVPLMFALPYQANADEEDRVQGKRMHDRITGVPPSAEVLNQMEALIEAGDDLAAAMLAMENDGFYDVTLKNMVAPWTNEAQSVFVPLNDYTATVIGLVRDNRDFRRVLYDDIIYVGRSSLGLPGYSNTSNAHYEALEEGGYPLQEALVEATQSSVTGLPSAATAGIMTTRAAAQAFFSAGTNRAMLRFTLMNHLCNDLEQLNDTTRAPDRIRQDVSRSPGGDSRIFLNSCVGCHSGMDPLAQAFAYYDFRYDANTDPDAQNGQLVYNTPVDNDTASAVQGKYLINSTTFEYGFVTTDDRWDNYWRAGQNELLGWDNRLPGTGTGATSMGRELAHSDAFASCQVKKVFKTVCLRDPVDGADRNQIRSMTSSFVDANYNLKQVFAESAVYCKGE